MTVEAPNFVAGGDINPCRFVKISDDFTVVHAGESDYVTGISQEGLRNPDTPDVPETLAAKTGEQLDVHGDFEYCLLELGGTEDVLFGDWLSPDADAKGIPSLNMYDEGRNRHVGAEALQSGSPGDFIRVRCKRHRGDTID